MVFGILRKLDNRPPCPAIGLRASDLTAVECLVRFCLLDAVLLPYGCPRCLTETFSFGTKALSVFFLRLVLWRSNSSTIQATEVWRSSYHIPTLVSGTAPGVKDI